jgi:glyoxylase I family protein
MTNGRGKKHGGQMIKGVCIETSGMHHVGLRSTDLARSRVFYIERLGFPVLSEAPGFFEFSAGSTTVAISGWDAHDRGHEHHLGLASTHEHELKRVARELTSAGIQNTGVTKDIRRAKNYVAFMDPDGIAWQVYTT